MSSIVPTHLGKGSAGNETRILVDTGPHHGGDKVVNLRKGK